MTPKILPDQLLIRKKFQQCFLLMSALLIVFQTQGQVRFTQVDPASDEFTIHNFGSSMVDISGYRLCSKFVYSPGPLSNLTVLNGSLMLASGASVTVSGFSLDDNAADFGLYLPTGSFGSSTAMVDFLQWGSSVPGRENVAVAKGIWSPGHFIDGTGTYTYTGSGSQNGRPYWLPSNGPIVRISSVTPSKDEFSLTNYGTDSLDISAWRLCSRFVYTPGPLSAVNLVSGSLHLGPGETANFSGWALDDVSADFAIYLPTGSFGSASNMVDFVQWGAGGIGREGLADSKGLWTAGTFISGFDPYNYVGNGTDNGAGFWTSSPVTRVAHLNGNQQNPPVLTLAKGTVTAVLDDSDSTLVVSGSFSNLKGDFAANIGGGAHIHTGYAGQNGGVALALNSDLDTDLKGGSFDPDSNTFKLTAAQFDAFINRQFYVNIHTTAYPSGEIRGQLLSQSAEYFFSHLYGSYHGSGVLSNAAGAVAAELNGNTLTLSGSFANLKGDFAANIAGGAHLHGGLAGQGGGIEVSLNTQVDAGLKSGIYLPDSNTYVLTSDQVDMLRGRGLYMNIHTTAHTSGEIRGQLHGMAQAVFRGHFSGANQNPPVTTEAGGQALLEIVDDTTLIVSGSFGNLESDFAANIGGGAHIHTGIAGSNGGVAFPLNSDIDGGNRSGTFAADSNTFTIDSAIAANLMARMHYLNIHTSANTSGEIRAQVLPEGMYFMHANMSGSQARLPILSDAAGTVKAEVRGTSLVISGSFSGLEGDYSNSHVHLGPVGMNGGVAIPLNPTLDGDSRGGDFEADSNTFTISTGLRDTLMNRGLYVNIHSSASPGGEIRGQLLAEAAAYFVASMSGTSQRTPVNTGAYGKAIIELLGSRAITVGSFSALESDFASNIAGGAHIHGGLPGQNSGILFSLNSDLAVDNRSGVFEADSNTFTMSAGQIDSLRNRMMYTNIHTADNGGGEIRGNFMNQANIYLTTSASGKNASVPVDTDGQGALKLELTGDKLVVTGAFSGLTGDFDASVAGGAHLHNAAPGSNGGISVFLTASLDSVLTRGAFLADSNTFELDSAQMANIKAGNMYLNIHTTEVGSGEIRGQILPEINFFPSDAPMITAPGSGDTLDIAGADSTEFTSMWSASTDQTALAYTWQLSDTTDFSRLIIQDNVGDQLSYTTDFGIIDSLLADAGLNVGDTIKLYHRAIASDGAVCTEGMMDSVVLVRGVVTALDPSFWEGLELDIYPNPSSGLIQLKIVSDQHRQFSVTIRDIYGRSIQQEEIQVSAGSLIHPINIEAYPAGIYFLQLKQDEQTLPAFKLYKQ